MRRKAALLGFFNTGALVSWQITLPAGANASQPITFKAYVSSLEHNLPLDKAVRRSPGTEDHGAP